MTDIQARLADINARAQEAQKKRDRDFWRYLAAIWIGAIVIIVFAFSVPRAREADRIWTLDHQEQIAFRR